MNIQVKAGDSINKALENARDGDTILLDEGVYHEKIKISLNNITIIGKGIDKTVIANKDYSPKIHADGCEYNTFRTYTLMAYGNNISISNLTIENESVPSLKYGQAVALHVLGDNFCLTNSRLLSQQDTLFIGPLPPNLQVKYKGFLPDDELKADYIKSYFKNCLIEGDVDFIFGGGDAIFDSCHLHGNNIQGYFFAPSHNPDQEIGFICFNCKFTSATNKMHLARPWRDYGKVTLLDCDIQQCILKEGVWDFWKGTERFKTARFSLYNTNIDTTCVDWSKTLTDKEAQEYYKYKK